MKTLIATILVLCSVSNAFADCDWSTIKPLSNGDFEYSKELHLCVANLIQDNKVKDQQITDYTKAIQLKDLALSNSDQRVQLWTKTAEDEQDRMAKLSADQSRSSWLYFGLGVLTVIGSGFMTAKLISK